MNINIKQLKCLCEVINCGNFTLAAENLYMSQSTVSKNIIALEKEIGFSILERKGNSTRLTPNGKKIMKHVSDIMISNKRLEFLIDELQYLSNPQIQSTIKLFSVPVIGELDFMPKVNAYIESAKDHHVNLNIMEEDQILHTLSLGDCDIAFCSNTHVDQNIYHTQKFTTQKFCIVVSNKNHLFKRDTIKMTDLENENLIVCGQESMLLGVCVNACKKSGFEPQIAFATNRPDIALQYIRSNDSAYMSLDLKAHIHDPEKHKKIKLLDGPIFDYVFAWRKDSTLSKQQKDFLEFMKV